jgi:Dienelactone hydrolase family
MVPSLDFSKNCIIALKVNQPNINRTGYFSLFMVVLPWLWNHRQAVTTPIVKSFFQILRTENPDLKIGVAGFCWGGRYSVLLGQKSYSDTPLVDVVFAGHPSFLSIPADIDKPICPASIAVASTDSVYSPKSAAKTEELWKQISDMKFEIIIYEGAKHGFCVRGNMNDEKEKEHMEKSAEQVSLLRNEVNLRLSNGLIRISFKVLMMISPGVSWLQIFNAYGGSRWPPAVSSFCMSPKYFVIHISVYCFSYFLMTNTAIEMP